MIKLLYFYPDNPLIFNQGNNARANKLLQYFKNRNFEVDFVGEKNDNFTESDLRLLEKEKIINKGYLIRKPKRGSGLYYLFANSIPNKIKSIFNSEVKPFKKRIGYKQKEDFETILKSNRYDYIIISYALFAPFVSNKNLLKNAKTIVDTHDFLTAQFSSSKDFKLGKYFEAEINLLNIFDHIWSISTEEKYIFSQFLPLKNVIIIAHGIENKSSYKNNNASIDIFYVASNNNHNIESAKWFFDKVYPLLPKNINFKVVGRVCSAIPDLDNVEKIIFAEHLNSFYENCKITICPMLSGTGLKIKVVESLSYGIPVVCNERGLDGLLCKVNNGCLASNNETVFARSIIKLLTNKNYYDLHVNNATNFFNSSLDEKIVFKNLDNFFYLNA